MLRARNSNLDPERLEPKWLRIDIFNIDDIDTVDGEVSDNASTIYGEDDGANDYEEDEDRDYEYNLELQEEIKDDVECTLIMNFKFYKNHHKVQIYLHFIR